MEKEQLEKKVAWLDSERRKTQETISELEKRLAAIEKTQSKTPDSKASANPTTRLAAIDKQIAALEQDITMLRGDIKKQVQEIDKGQKEQAKLLQQDQKTLSKVVEEFRNESGQLQSLQKTLNPQKEQLEQLGGAIPRLEEAIAEVFKNEARRDQLARKLEESSKEDAQRLTEMRAEVAALLPRLEEAAKQVEKAFLSNRKMEKRMDELVATDAQSKLDQKKFFESSALAQTERERIWKEWEKRFQSIEQQSGQISAHLKDVETTDLAVKRAQRAFDELVEKINRRINELGEIQRLGDQRFRGEWSTFQTDVQKRWAAFTLSYEEQQRDGVRHREKLASQIAQVEDSMRDMQDSLQHLVDQSERNMQALLELARDSLAENERFLSNQR